MLNELILICMAIVAPAVGFAVYCIYQAEISMLYRQFDDRNAWYAIGVVAIIIAAIALVAVVPELAVG